MSTTEIRQARDSASRPLGRRPGDSDTRELILDAAEQEFAARGYALTSLREIAERVDVNQALVRYYFGSKEGLFHAIFRRGAQKIGEDRLALLDALESRPGKPPGVEEIVRAFLLPAIDMRRKGAVGAAFMRLQARLQHEPKDITQKLRLEVYEESSRRYIAALARALPHIRHEAIYWRYVFMVGAYLYTISDSNHLETLSGGACSSRNIDEAVRQLVAFLVGGLNAPR
jgi:AcrR family transcriptional regulator